MTVVDEMVRKAIEAADMGGNVNIQPEILMNRNYDASQVTEITGLIVNDSWAGKIKEHLDSGWTLFRVQTELRTTGHQTWAYLAKFKEGYKLD